MQDIDCYQFRKMLKAAADEVIRSKVRLSELDTFIGDGDHGTTIARTMEVMMSAAESSAPDDLKAMLEKVGWAILGVNGGATGPLFGSLFLGLSEGLAAAVKIDAKVLAEMFKKSQERVLGVSGANAGDKTLIDALLPAVSAIVENIGVGDVRHQLEAAADAAEKGAQATTNMVAKKGRAKNMSQRSVGHQDPGATSLALLLRGLSIGAGIGQSR